MKSRFRTPITWFASASLLGAALAAVAVPSVSAVATAPEALAGKSASVYQDISRPLQQLVERELALAVEAHQAKSGSVVVLDARSGRILALANFSSALADADAADADFNPAVMEASEPGAVMSPILMAAALESRSVYPEITRIDTGPGWFQVGDRLIRDDWAKGVLSLAEALQLSSNVAVARIAQDVPAQEYWTLLDKAGFGHPPGHGLPEEGAGELPHYTDWTPGQQAQMAYGQGMTATLLQIARAYAAIANDGVMPPLALPEPGVPDMPEQVMSAETARQLRDMLEGVVAPGATGLLAQVEGYRVAGKTGSTLKVVNGQLDESKVLARFVGFAPADAPRLVVAVLIDEPGGELRYGGVVAAPLFARIMADGLKQLGVAPQ